jgi:acetyltransferase-like isoleucine patch superfamily enzyme
MREPRAATRVALALLRGNVYRAYYRLTGRRFRAGPDFRVFGRLSISGPGEVVFGAHVSISGHVTPWTHALTARITVGDDSALDSVRFGCKQEITIGRRCMIAECRIMDTDFHSTRVDRRINADAPARIAPVRIGDNVWVGLEVGILPGAIIGENSVVSYGAICAREFPPNSVIMGNPARVISRIPDADGSETVGPSGAAPVKAPAIDGIVNKFDSSDSLAAMRRASI